MELNSAQYQQLTESFRGRGSAVLFLDYDGTLVPYALNPDQARPDAELIRLLEHLGALPRVDVVIISGRSRQSLERWVGGLPVHLVAEHGAWVRMKEKSWGQIKKLSHDWKSKLLPLFQAKASGLEGVFVEEKEYSLVWHYRAAEPEPAKRREKELLEELSRVAGHAGVEVLMGSKMVEARSQGISKGIAGEWFLKSGNHDFILALGDDTTDEDLFAAMPPGAYSFRVGGCTRTNARFTLAGVPEARALLRDLPGDLTER